MTHPSLGMGTTGGTWPLVGAKPKRNATIVQGFVDAGMIILAKGNLTVRARKRPLTMKLI
jgi:Asp-tRNA(Asn)/Glu-tRNA(Gln) amidotransferase A subunit family amidase